MSDLKVTGRILPISESTRKRNPEIYGKAPCLIGDSPLGSQAETRPTAKRRLRQSSKPLLNRLETEYRDLLRLIYPNRIILEQAIKFRLANGVWLCPDLFVWNDGRSMDMAFDVKGPQQIQDDAAVKLKVAAKEYPHIQWFVVWVENGTWKEQRVLS